MTTETNRNQCASAKGDRFKEQEIPALCSNKHKSKSKLKAKRAPMVVRLPSWFQFVKVILMQGNIGSNPL
ncbi:hypothetical protein SLE2022_024070 [Rubroshorea leprosula]